MKHLLRKIFFWDTPAQGAFFSLTLLIVLQRCFWPILIGVILPVFLRNDSIGTALFCVELFLGAVLVVYSLVCLYHFCPKKAFSKVSAVVVFACAVIILAVWAVSPEHLKAVTTVFTILFIFWVLAYSFHPVVKIQDWMFALVPLLELVPDLIHPKYKKSLLELHEAIENPEDIVLFGTRFDEL